MAGVVYPRYGGKFHVEVDELSVDFYTNILQQLVGYEIIEQSYRII